MLLLVDEEGTLYDSLPQAVKSQTVAVGTLVECAGLLTQQTPSVILLSDVCSVLQASNVRRLLQSKTTALIVLAEDASYGGAMAAQSIGACAYVDIKKDAEILADLMARAFSLAASLAA